MSERLTVESAETGTRLDQFVHARLPQYSRAYLQKLIREGHILVGSKSAKQNAKVRSGDLVTVAFPAPRPLEIEPEVIPLKILHEDQDLLVLNKSPGMVVHPGAGNQRGTLVNALLAHCGASLSGIGGVLRPGIVHRLDKDTSGMMVVAKTDAAHRALSAQFKARTVSKTYLALVRGSMERDKGVISAALGRHPTQRKKISVVTDGREALTEYVVERRFASATLVRCHPKTGRTHQIRVHLAKLGHPIIGDRVYSRKQTIDAPRQMLHAHQLGFTHPATGKWLEFTAPMPDDMERIVRAMMREERET